MENWFTAIVLFVLTIGIALPVTIGLSQAAGRVSADIQARYDSVDWPE